MNRTVLYAPDLHCELILKQNTKIEDKDGRTLLDICESYNRLYWVSDRNLENIIDVLKICDMENSNEEENDSNDEKDEAETNHDTQKEDQTQPDEFETGNGI